MSGYVYDFLFKVVLAGNAGVGKTSLLQAMHGNFDEPLTSKYTDFGVTTVQNQDGTTTKLQIWDQPEYRPRVLENNCLYRGCQCVVLMCDPSQGVEILRNQVASINMDVPSSAAKLMVCTKSDLGSYDTSLFLDFADQNGFEFCGSISAKTGANVETFLRAYVATRSMEAFNRRKALENSLPPRTPPTVTYVAQPGTNVVSPKIIVSVVLAILCFMGCVYLTRPNVAFTNEIVAGVFIDPSVVNINVPNTFTVFRTETGESVVTAKSLIGSVTLHTVDIFRAELQKIADKYSSEISVKYVEKAFG